MHVRRRADPDNVDVRERHQLRPIFYWRSSWHILPAKPLGAFICGIGNRYDLDIWIRFQRRQMSGANNVARADDADPQFLIIFVHWLTRYQSCRLDWPWCELNLTAKETCAFNHGFPALNRQTIELLNREADVTIQLSTKHN